MSNPKEETNMSELLEMFFRARNIFQEIRARELKTIYFDLDGVLADFFGRIKQLKPDGISLQDYTQEVFEKNTKLSKEFWNQMDYSTLGVLAPGVKLLKWVVAQKEKEANIKIVILGSTGSKKFHARSKAQKLEWLKTNDLKKYFDELIFVPGKSHKRKYANSKSFLIDDTKINIEQFIEDGGSALLYKNYTTTKKAIQKFLEDAND